MTGCGRRPGLHLTESQATECHRRTSLLVAANRRGCCKRPDWSPPHRAPHRARKRPSHPVPQVGTLERTPATEALLAPRAERKTRPPSLRGRAESRECRGASEATKGRGQAIGRSELRCDLGRHDQASLSGVDHRGVDPRPPRVRRSRGPELSRQSRPAWSCIHHIV